MQIPNQRKIKIYFDGNYELIISSDEKTSAKKIPLKNRLKFYIMIASFFEERAYMAAFKICTDVFFRELILMTAIWISAFSIKKLMDGCFFT